MNNNIKSSNELKAKRCSYCGKILPEGVKTYCNDECKERKHISDKNYRSKAESKTKRTEYQRKWVSDHREEWNAYMRSYNKSRKASKLMDKEPSK